MRKISLVASALLLSSTMAMAESNSIKEAFANGTTSGDLTIYTEGISNDIGPDSGFSAGSVGLNYETDTFNGVSLSLGLRAQHHFAEDENGDGDAAYATKSVLNVAAIKYANDNFFVSVGRQEIDLEWIGDYNEAIVVGVTAIPNTTIVAGFSNRIAEIAFDVVEDWTDIGTDGVYVVDVKNTSIGNLELNPYFYSAPNVVDFYGLKVSYDNDIFGATAHYVASSVDESVGLEDGNVLNVEGRLNIAGVSLALGYIDTDKDGGAGLIAVVGDNLSPLDENVDTFEQNNASTTYASVGYEIAGVALAVVYGQTDYNDNDESAELNLIAEYSITEALSVGALYVDYSNDDDANVNEWNKLVANITYAF